ncbi:MAG: hypothetical protein U0166_06375 [Acidobacteriota bacterium]
MTGGLRALVAPIAACAALTCSASGCFDAWANRAGENGEDRIVAHKFTACS